MSISYFFFFFVKNIDRKVCDRNVSDKLGLTKNLFLGCPNEYDKPIYLAPEIIEILNEAS